MEPHAPAGDVAAWWRDRVVWAVAGATAVALGLALYRLGTLSLWVDEGVSYAVSHESWGGVASHAARREPNFGLYYIGLKIWTVLGSTEAVLRLPSAVFAAATVPVVAAVANRLAGRRAAVVAAVLAAVHATLLHWAQEVRPYTLVVFLVTLSALLLMRAGDQPSRSRWAAWAVVATLACYAHTFGAVTVAAQAGARLFRGSPRRPLLAASAAVLVAATPLVVLTLLSPTGRISWIPAPGWDDVSFVLEELTGSAGTALAVAFGVAALVGLASIRFADRIFVASWCAAPFLFALAASLRQPLFQDRYLLVCVPALVIAAAAGLARLRPTFLLVAAVAGFAALSVTGLVDWYSGAGQEDWRAAARQVASDARAGDAVIVADGDEVFRYYYLPAPGPHANVLVIGTPGLAARVRGARRVWLVLRGSSEKSDRGRRLAAAEGRRLAGRWRPTLVQVELYARP